MVALPSLPDVVVEGVDENEAAEGAWSESRAWDSIDVTIGLLLTCSQKLLKGIVEHQDILGSGLHSTLSIEDSSAVASPKFLLARKLKGDFVIGKSWCVVESRNEKTGEGEDSEQCSLALFNYSPVYPFSLLFRHVLLIAVDECVSHWRVVCDIQVLLGCAVPPLK